MRTADYITKVIQQDFTYCSRASNALYVLLQIMDQKGKFVIFPDIMCHGPVVSALTAGYRVAFCDVSLRNFSLDPVSLEQIIVSKDVGFVVAPHMYGYPCSLHEISTICKKHNVFLIEDAAQAYGLHYYSPHYVGVADATLYSFGNTKIIPLGSGGILSSSDRILLNDFETCYDNLEEFTASDLDLINEYSSAYYKVNHESEKQKLKMLFHSLSPVYQKRLRQLPFDANFELFEKQLKIFERRQQLFETYRDIVEVDHIDDPESFVPWRFSFLYNGNRTACLNYLRAQNVHCSSWYQRLGPVFESDVLEINNSTIVESSVINFWVDPNLPNEYYDAQFKLIAEGLTKYANV